MWIKNLKTGLKWNVTRDLAERLSLSRSYKIIDTPSETSKNNHNDNLDELTVNELRKLASKNKIEGYSNMKKSELIKALKG